MSAPETSPVSVIPAATVVVFRHCPQGGPPQLLMLQRSKTMRFAGGAAVFPGGRIDPADRALAARLLPDADPEDSAARVAAVRETLEESGLAIAVTQAVSAQQAAEARAWLEQHGDLAAVLDRFGWTLALDRLIAFARWCPQKDGAFDTHFYLADLGTGAVDIAVDDTENTHLFWASAAQALDMAEAGDISVIFPTQCNLQRLAQFASFAEARTHAERFPPITITPRREMRGDTEYLTIPDHRGYPVTALPMKAVKRG